MSAERPQAESLNCDKNASPSKLDRALKHVGLRGHRIITYEGEGSESLFYFYFHVRRTNGSIRIPSKIRS